MEKDNKKLNSKPTQVKKSEAKVVKPGPKLDKKKKEVKTEVKAKARFIRVAPRKVRLVINQLKGLGAQEALDYLKFVNKAAVRPVTKLINSAVANAENNFSLAKEDLYIKQIIANDGPVLKRWRPRAYGRSAAIRKKTSHIEVVLGVKAGAKLKPVTKKETKKPVKESTEKATEVKVVKPEEVRRETPKIGGRGPQEKGKAKKGFFKGIFQRKTG